MALRHRSTSTYAMLLALAKIAALVAVLLCLVATVADAATLLQRVQPFQIPGATFGFATMSDGDRVVIAAPTAFIQLLSAPSGFGAISMFNVTSTGLLSLEQTVASPASARCANFTNYGLSLSAARDVLAVGSPAATTCPGAVFLYRWNASNLTPLAEISPALGSLFSDGFGSQVHLDDNVLLSTIPRNSSRVFALYSLATGTFAVESGPHYITVPALSANSDISIAVKGCIAIASSTDRRVFILDYTGVQRSNLTAPTTTGRFGASIALSWSLLAVGAPGYFAGDTDRVYLYTRVDTYDFTLLKFLSPSQSTTNFGVTVRLTGGLLAVGSGSVFSNSGPVFVFGRNAGGPSNWGVMDTLQPPADLLVADFGQSIAFARGVVVVGAPLAAGPGRAVAVGTALVYQFQSPLASVSRVTPTVVPVTGGYITVIGTNLAYVLDVLVGLQATPNMTQLADGSLLVFALPVPTLQYASVTVVQSDRTRSTLYNALFYAENCIRAGLFWTGSVCENCPPGAFCPGGGRIWPAPGWWNTGELSGFVAACIEPATERCPGGQTSPCGPGYTGPLCGRCDSGFYSLQGACRSCAPSGVLVLLYLLQFSMFAAVAFATLKLTGYALGNLTFALYTVRIMWVVAKTSSAELPLVMQQFLGVLGLFVGDMSFVQPGCQSLHSFVDVFGLNIGVIVAMILVTVLIMIGRHRLLLYQLRRTYERNPRWHDIRQAEVHRFHQRITAGVVTLVAFVYELVVVLSFSALYCTRQQTSEGVFELVLVSDPAQRCFVGGHIAVFAVGLVLAAAMTLFPIVQGVLLFLRRRAGLRNVVAKVMNETLVEEFREEAQNIGIVFLVLLDYVLALAAVFLTDELAQFTVMAAVLATVLVLIFARWPFADPRRNLGLAYVAVASALQQVSALLSGTASTVIAYITFGAMLLYMAALVWLLLFNTIMFKFCRPRGLSMRLNSRTAALLRVMHLNGPHGSLPGQKPGTNDAELGAFLLDQPSSAVAQAAARDAQLPGLLEDEVPLRGADVLEDPGAVGEPERAWSSRPGPDADARAALAPDSSAPVSVPATAAPPADMHEQRMSRLISITSAVPRDLRMSLSRAGRGIAPPRPPPLSLAGEQTDESSGGFTSVAPAAAPAGPTTALASRDDTPGTE